MIENENIKNNDNTFIIEDNNNYEEIKDNIIYDINIRW